MKILFDQGTPAPLRALLSRHMVVLSKELGWSQLSNGALLSQAEQAGFDVLLTTDKSIKFQQNLSGRKIAVLVLDNPDWNYLRIHPAAAVDAIERALGSKYAVIEI
jgi:hypothetical protein